MLTLCDQPWIYRESPRGGFLSLLRAEKRQPHHRQR